MMQNEGIQALRATRNKLEAEYQEKLLTFTSRLSADAADQAPDFRAIDKQLEAEVKLIKSGVSAIYQAAATRSRC
jgi:hypothetical protein